MTAGAVRWHTCPVCLREVAQQGGVWATFYRHSDTAGNWCPMSGKPVPPMEEVPT
jgi:hypothetical protein